jgi:hypothetical protein
VLCNQGGTASGQVGARGGVFRYLRPGDDATLGWFEAAGRFEGGLALARRKRARWIVLGPDGATRGELALDVVGVPRPFAGGRAVVSLGDIATARAAVASSAVSRWSEMLLQADERHACTSSIAASLARRPPRATAASGARLARDDARRDAPRRLVARVRRRDRADRDRADRDAGPRARRPDDRDRDLAQRAGAGSGSARAAGLPARRLGVDG